ncbi:MAG: UDP-N-acetylmuramoyl-L-alanine--D-glutamate ligase [Clostridia bacterium]|nr:UDP-N-acetylmuramoyl-L-alanine--D-glutamate ligase [Clostridia bacterium]
MIKKGMKVLIVGGGKTGQAAAKTLHDLGAHITLTDIRKKEDLENSIKGLSNLKLNIFAGGYPHVSRENTQLVIVSPGVPLDIPPIKDAYDNGIPVWSEIELAFRLFDAPMIAVTGTNGKTTTTALIGEIFRNAGRPTVVAGNIGLPLIEKIGAITKEHIVVLELSSFQLESINKFRAKVAILLNLTPDHMDRHGTFENYMGAKENIFFNQGPDDFSILNYDDVNVRGMAEKTKGNVIFFSLQHTLKQGAYLDGDNICLALKNKKVVLCDRGDVFIKGEHNLQNALAASAAAGIMGVSFEYIKESLKTFPGVAHRLEFVAEKNKVKYINDSKGTNPDATIKAIGAYEEPIILIAGGRNKGSDFNDLSLMVKENVKTLILMGEAAEEIRASLDERGFKDIHMVTSMEEAVTLASKKAVPGEVVLLSPACASWDMFESYEERGDLFKKQVMALGG